MGALVTESAGSVTAIKHVFPGAISASVPLCAGDGNVHEREQWTTITDVQCDVRSQLCCYLIVSLSGKRER